MKRMLAQVNLFANEIRDGLVLHAGGQRTTMLHRRFGKHYVSLNPPGMHTYRWDIVMELVGDRFDEHRTTGTGVLLE